MDIGEEYERENIATQRGTLTGVGLFRWEECSMRWKKKVRTVNTFLADSVRKRIGSTKKEDWTLVRVVREFRTWYSDSKNENFCSQLFTSNSKKLFSFLVSSSRTIQVLFLPSSIWIFTAPLKPLFVSLDSWIRSTPKKFSKTWLVWAENWFSIIVNDTTKFW